MKSECRLNLAMITPETAASSAAAELHNAKMSLGMIPNLYAYMANAQVMFQTAATTTGIRLTQTVPAGATVVAQWNTPTSLTAVTAANQRAADAGAATTAIDAANANTLATASLLVITGATAGSLQIRFASEVAASNAVIKAGSCLVATKVG